MGRLNRGRIHQHISVSALHFEQCPAKTWSKPDGIVVQGRTVFNHCQIVGEIAKKLMSRFPEPLRSRLFPVGSEMAVASHDIGKVSPTFVAKILGACGIDFKNIPELANTRPEREKQWGGHAGVSQATAEALNTPKYVAEILGQHHGFNPSVDDKSGKAEPFGGEPWFNEREKLVFALKTALGADWPTFSGWEQARVVAGLTSVADWIGSGQFFENPEENWQPKIDAALNDAGFIKTEINPNLSFADVFAKQGQTITPRPAQALFLQQVTEPGVYILEAQMGMGKTEAALYAAYQLLQSAQATGIYFALPTQLTSNKIYDRFNQFLDRIVGPQTPNRALLLHSGAWLLDHAEMGEEGCPGGAWFNQNKRGLLAPFAVGTIDQALMAVMNVKHGFVRAFGLAGKVVILDEVHSYDLYTGTILNELVAFLRKLGCTVIILSATLSQQRREALLQQTSHSRHYPLITAAQCDKPLLEVAVSEADKDSVVIHLTDDSDALVEQALERAEQGEQVLWIENTVKDAQQRYLDLAAQARLRGADIGMLHSRFTPQHRQLNEAIWVKNFGKEGWETRPNQGRILVGTQVLEQSLDIDADFLVTRFAPTDMLLQRIGRLWRHADTPRSVTATPECWLLAPAIEHALSAPTADIGFGASASVYSPYVLCRSLEVWQSVSSITLPMDIRGLIDRTYADRQENSQWQVLKEQLKHGTRYRTGEEALQMLARLTLSRNGKTLPEHKAETRYSDMDTHEVLLLKSLWIDKQNRCTRLTLLDDQQLALPHQKYKLTKADWRGIAVRLHQQLVRIKPSDCPPQLMTAELEKLGLGNVFYLGNPEQDEAVLRVALVNDSHQLTTLDANPIPSLEYRDDLGYRVLLNKH